MGERLILTGALQAGGEGVNESAGVPYIVLEWFHRLFTF